MQFLWPYGLISLAVVAVAAWWAMRRPLRQIVPVSSLRMWRQAVASAGAEGRKRRRYVSAAWLALLAGAVLGGLALTRPVWHTAPPARSIAVAYMPSAELIDSASGDGRPAILALLDRLGPLDRVRLVLPEEAGGVSGWLSVDQTRRHVLELPLLPLPAEQLTLPPAPADVDHLYRFVPACLPPVDGPSVTTIPLPSLARGEMCIDAFSAETLPDGQVQLLLAVRSQTPNTITPRGSLRAGAGPLTDVKFDAVEPLGRTVAVATMPPAEYYVARLANCPGPGGTAWLVRRESAVAAVAMIGKDDPLVRRFVQVHTGLHLVADAAKADFVVAVGVEPPAGKPALVIAPPKPPPPFSAGPGAPGLAPFALADAARVPGAPGLADVDLAGVAVRKSAAWKAGSSAGLANQKRLLTLQDNALIVTDESPRRVWLAFDLSTDNTNWPMHESFVVFLDNVSAWLAPRGRAQVEYVAQSPAQAGPARQWEPVESFPAAGGVGANGAAAGANAPTPGEAASSPAATRSADATPPGMAAPLARVARTTWPLPGLYRDRAGGLHAVNLLGLRAASVARPPVEVAAHVALPAPRPIQEGQELWPILALLAAVCWLAGWMLRTR